MVTSRKTNGSCLHTGQKIVSRWVDNLVFSRTSPICFDQRSPSPFPIGVGSSCCSYWEGQQGLVHSNADSAHVHFLPADGFPCLCFVCVSVQPGPPQAHPFCSASPLGCFWPQQHPDRHSKIAAACLALTEWVARRAVTLLWLWSWCCFQTFSNWRVI